MRKKIEKNILVVDDDADIRESIFLILHHKLADCRWLLQLH